MIASFIFWFILFYLLYKLIFGFVIPVVTASRKARSTMRDMRENMGQFQQNESQPFSSNSTFQKGSEKSTAASKGDYIDFEEVKE